MLHPFRDTRRGIFLGEPIVTTGQLLTPEQKKHLSEFQERNDLFHHLSSYHGMPFSTDVSTGLDPQVAERFGLPQRPYTSDLTLRLRHLQEHFENMAEKYPRPGVRNPGRVGRTIGVLG
jgi:hypothetical protein